MESKEILTKAIEKAEENGFDTMDISIKKNQGVLLPLCMEEVIFSHDFAKAFWKDGYKCNICGKMLFENEECCEHDYDYKSEYADVGWDSHLREMVVEDEPLKYLERFLDD